MLEPREVVRDPGQDQQSARKARRQRELRPLLPRDLAAAPARDEVSEWDCQQRKEADRLGATQRGERDAQSHEHRGADSRRVPEPVAEKDGDRDGEHVHALRHQHLVVDPEVRVGRGQHGGGPAGPVVPEDVAGEHAEREHRARAEERRRQSVRQLAGSDEAGDGREIEEVGGRVARARRDLAEDLVPKGIDEPETLGDEDGLPVVVRRVAVERDATTLVDDIEDAPRERQTGDRAEADVEAPRVLRQAVERPRHDSGT